MAIVDPEDRDADLGRLLEFFEDADEPVRGEERLDERLAMALEGIDYDVQSPSLSVAAVLIMHLWRHPLEIEQHPSKLLQVAARAEWKGEPPTLVEEWLAQRGVEA